MKVKHICGVRAKIIHFSARPRSWRDKKQEKYYETHGSLRRENKHESQTYVGLEQK